MTRLMQSGSTQKPTPERCAKKWAPLLDGLVGRARLLTACVLESEARFLAENLDPRREYNSQSLTYIFPVIKMSMLTWTKRSPLLLLAECVDHDPDVVGYQALKNATERAFEKALEMDRSRCTVREAGEWFNLETLVDRMWAAIQSFPEVCSYRGAGDE